MYEPFETFEHEGYTCELHYDTDPWSPAEWDQLGELAELGNLGYTFFGSCHDGAEEAAERGGEALSRFLYRSEGIIAVPFYFADYGSSGARIYESDDPNGYIYATRESIEKIGTPMRRVREGLRAELREWDHYFRGEVYGYVLRSPDGEDLDSCWGFYPDEDGDGLSYLRSEVRDMAEWHAQQDAEQYRYMAV